MNNYQIAQLSIENFFQQTLEIIKDFKNLKIPVNYYRQIEQVVICGMGGSGLAGHILRSLLAEQLKLPFYLINDYYLPSFVKAKTLIIICSYSGNTQEVLATARIAKQKKAKVFVISGGGKLNSLAQQNNWPSYVVNKKLNPSLLPNLGVIQMFVSQLVFLQKIKLSKLTSQEIRQSAEDIYKRRQQIFYVAKKYAKQLAGRPVVIVASEFLSGNAHALANQINEIAKQFAVYLLLPELNHHLLEGLSQPPVVVKKFKFLFFDSINYSIINRHRLELTRKVLAKQKIVSLKYQLSSSQKLEQILEGLLFSFYLSLSLSELNQVNPLALPWVKYFKQNLRG
ncbi:MAG: SIS domain-containing protein [Candidatus Buchananbacteria bacterium]